MFFYKRLKKELLLEPMYLGPNLMTLVRDRIISEVEGTCLGNLGYVVSIQGINEEDIRPGFIDNDTGSVNVVVWYSAILFRPFTSEIVDAVVTSASDSQGFFCKVGPMSIFVSHLAVPDDIKFDTVREDCWVSAQGDVEIREGSLVRLRIMGLTVEANLIRGVGSMRDNYTGLIDTVMDNY